MPSAWPGTLPQQLSVDSYGEDVPNVLIRTDMEVGPAKVRRRLSNNVRKFTGSLFLTTAQVATLDTFYLTTLEGGALTFTWTHPRTAAAATYRFVSPPKYTAHSGQTFFAAVELEILP